MMWLLPVAILVWHIRDHSKEAQILWKGKWAAHETAPPSKTPVAIDKDNLAIGGLSPGVLYRS